MCLAMPTPTKVGLHTTGDAVEVVVEEQQLHTDTVPLSSTTRLLAQILVPTSRLLRQATTMAKHAPHQLRQHRLATAGLQSAIATCS
jgi:hypothetical protein